MVHKRIPREIRPLLLLMAKVHKQQKYLHNYRGGADLFNYVVLAKPKAHEKL